MAQNEIYEGTSARGQSGVEWGSGPGPGWVALWALLVTASIPAALALMAPLGALFLWTGLDAPALTVGGFFIGLGVFVALAQWLMLRRRLPQAGRWFWATAAGLLAGGLAAWVGIVPNIPAGRSPLIFQNLAFLAIGLVLGLAQFLVLRRLIPHAFWILLIDVLAVRSFFAPGGSFGSLIELAVFLVLPGLVSGVGMWLLLRQARVGLLPQVTRARARARLPRVAWVWLGVLALVPLFFAFSWVYATSQLALAKDRGVYPTVEEALVAQIPEEWGDARLMRVEDVYAGPNSFDGSQPHVWFGGAKYYYDRPPQGYQRTDFSSGSFYLHVRDGWVHVPEGAFPEFIGWVMALYNLEGVE